MGIQRRRDADNVSRSVQLRELHPFRARVIVAKAAKEADLLVMRAVGRHQERHDDNPLDARRDQFVVRRLRCPGLCTHQVRRCGWRVLPNDRHGRLDIGVPLRRRAVSHD